MTFSWSKSIFKSISEVELSIPDGFQRHNCATVGLESWDLESIQKADTVITSSGFGVGSDGGHALQRLYVIIASTLHVLLNWESVAVPPHHPPISFFNIIINVLLISISYKILMWGAIICWLISVLYRWFFNLWLAFDMKKYTEMEAQTPSQALAWSSLIHSPSFLLQIHC